MKCPDLNNPILKTTRKVIGTNAAINSYNLNNGYSLDKAMNGEESILFFKLKAIGGLESAIKLKAKTLSKSFKDWHSKGGVIDVNGEPRIMYRRPSESYTNAIKRFPKLKEILDGYNFITEDFVPASDMIPVFIRTNKKAFTQYEISREELQSEDAVIKLNLLIKDAHNSVLTSHISNDIFEKRNMLVIKDVKDTLPIFKNGEFDTDTLQLTHKIPIFVGKYTNMSVEGTRKMAEENPTEKLKDARAAKDLFSNNENERLAEVIQNANNKKLGNLILRAVQHIMPGIKFHHETNDSTIETFGEPKTGWVDNNGEIHINLDMIDPELPIHELGHILEPLLKKNFPEAYNSAMNNIEQEVAAKEGLAWEYFNKYQKAGLFMELDNNAKRELFADILATTTIQKVKSLLAENGGELVKAESLLDKAKTFFDLLRSGARKLFAQMFNGSTINTVEDFGNALANQIFEGSQLDLTLEDKTFLTDYFNREGVMFSMKAEAAEISKLNLKNTNDIKKALIGKSFSKTTPYSRALAQANEGIRRAKSLKSTTINYAFAGKHFSYDKQTTPEVLAQKLLDDIINPSDQLKTKITEKLISYKEVGESLSELLGPNTSQNAITKLKHLTGIDGTVHEILKYSDLNKSKFDEVKALYNESFIGDDHLIIVHNISEATGVNLSIIDITSVPIKESFQTEGDRNIFSTFMTDAEYYNHQVYDGSLRKVGLGLSDSDIRNFNITLAAMNMMQVSKNKITFNKLGTINVNSKGAKGSMIFDMEGMVNNVYIFSQIPSIAEGVLSKELNDVITDLDLYKVKPKTAALELVISYLKQIVDSKINDPYFSNYAAFLYEQLEKGDSDARYKILLAMKARIENDTDPIDALKEDLYGYILKAETEITQTIPELLNDVQDISKFGKLLTSASQMKNDHVQNVVKIIQQASILITEKVMGDLTILGGTTGRPGLARKVQRQSFLKNPGLMVKRYVADTGSDVYRHLYKKKLLPKIVNGKLTDSMVTADTPELYWDKNDPETKKALADKIITELDLEFTNKVLDIMKGRWIEYFIHENNMRNRHKAVSAKYVEYTKEDAENEFNKLFPNKGMVPILEGSVSEFLLKGHKKKAVSKALRQVEFSEALLDDYIVGDQKMSDVFGRMKGFFTHQKEEEARLKAAGLVYFVTESGSEVLAVIDEVKNQTMSRDIWKTFSYFDQSLLRMIEYETSVLPIARSSISLLIQLGGENQKNNINYIEEYINKLAFRKNSDEELTFRILKGKPINVGTVARLVKSVLNAATLPFKMSIGAFSLLTNEVAIVTESLAGVIAKSKGIMPDVKYFHTATKLMLNPMTASLAKHLALENHVWGREERDLLENPWINVTDYFALNQIFTNIANYATDTFARTQVLLAVMAKDGSLDANVYNKKTGKIVYDETKDLRWYNKDGSKKIDNETLALYEAVMKDVMKLKGLKIRPKTLPAPYGVVDITHMKQLADTKVIGAYTQESAALLGNNWLGSLMMIYRQYLPTRLFNAGFLAETRKTKVGQRIVAKDLGDGEYVATEDVEIIEGQLQTVGKALAHLYETRSYTPEKMSELYKSMNDRERHNLAKSFIKVFQFMILAAAYGWLGDDENRYNKLSWEYWVWRMLGEITVLSAVLDIMKDPMPAIDMLLRAADKGSIYRLLPYYGSYHEVEQIVNPKNK